MIDAAEVARVLASLVPAAVDSAVAPIDPTAEASLFPEELAIVARAVSKRRNELATGRVLARRLLESLGFAPRPLLADPDRAPIWPPGAIGSISHTNELCAVLVARASAFRSVGVDVEPATPLEPELEPIVLRDDERALVGLLGKIVFSAKECAYKCQHPITRRMLEHHDVRIELDRSAGLFVATILVEPGMVVEGRFAVAAGTIVCAATKSV